MFVFGILVGVILGYIFKPQLEKVVIKAIRQLKDKTRDDHKDY